MTEDAHKALATYGSLAPGKPNHRHMLGMTGSWTVGTVRGRLVEAGWGAKIGFPGLVLDTDGEAVDVHLFISDDLPAHWERLDNFEGDGYRRVPAPIETPTGVVWASIYVVAQAA